MTTGEATKLAWQAWEDDQKTNPNPVNPHAFVKGYVTAIRHIKHIPFEVKSVHKSPFAWCLCNEGTCWGLKDPERACKGWVKG